MRLAAVAVLGAACAAAAGTTSERLRDEAGAEWTAITSDPFVDALAAGTLSNATLARYLVQDHQFLDAFLVLLASMVANAPTLADRLPGARFLGLVAGDENTYFERAFDELALSAVERAAPPAAATSAFVDLMRDAAASGRYHIALAVLVVAEWSYLEWGAAAAPAAGLSWLHLEWIDLHRGDDFAGVVAYLRGQLDALPLSAAEYAEARDWFLAAVDRERAFWAMARAGEPEL